MRHKCVNLHKKRSSPPSQVAELELAVAQARRIRVWCREPGTTRSQALPPTEMPIDLPDTDRPLPEDETDEACGLDSEETALLAAVDRALAEACEVQRQLTRATRRLEEIEDAGGPERALLVARNATALSGPGLVLRLLDRATRERALSATSALRWAEAAAHAGARDPSVPPVLVARAHAEVAHAHQARGDLEASRASFAEALERLETAAPNPALEGEIFSLLAQLEMKSERPEEALAALRRAEEAFRVANLEAELDQMQLRRAQVFVFQRRTSEALSLLVPQLQARLQTTSRVEDLLPLCHAVLWVLLDAALTTSDPQERSLAVEIASGALGGLRPLYDGLSPRWAARLAWLLGRLDLAEGRPSAPDRLERAYSAHLALGDHAAAARITLERAHAERATTDPIRAAPRLRGLAGEACEELDASRVPAALWDALEALARGEIEQAPPVPPPVPITLEHLSRGRLGTL